MSVVPHTSHSCVTAVCVFVGWFLLLLISRHKIHKIGLPIFILKELVLIPKLGVRWNGGTVELIITVVIS